MLPLWRVVFLGALPPVDLRAVCFVRAIFDFFTLLYFFIEYNTLCRVKFLSYLYYSFSFFLLSSLNERKQKKMFFYFFRIICTLKVI